MAPVGGRQPATRAEATRDQTGGLGGAVGPRAKERLPWGLGPALWQGAPPYWGPPPAASQAAFGHVGATGCVAWADPTAEVATAVLTTRFYGPWFDDVVVQLGTAILDAAGTSS